MAGLFSVGLFSATLGMFAISELEFSKEPVPIVLSSVISLGKELDIELAIANWGEMLFDSLRLNPQCPQNLASDNIVEWQLGHWIFLTIGNGVKQASQFTAPSGLE
jgi:hypothetical protein